jgi:hypothetical protein
VSLDWVEGLHRRWKNLSCAAGAFFDPRGFTGAPANYRALSRSYEMKAQTLVVKDKQTFSGACPFAPPFYTGR